MEGQAVPKIVSSLDREEVEMIQSESEESTTASTKTKKAGGSSVDLNALLEAMHASSAKADKTAEGLRCFVGDELNMMAASNAKNAQAIVGKFCTAQQRAFDTAVIEFRANREMQEAYNISNDAAVEELKIPVKEMQRTLAMLAEPIGSSERQAKAQHTAAGKGNSQRRSSSAEPERNGDVEMNLQGGNARMCHLILKVQVPAAKLQKSAI
jgi:hypothetical protein